MTATVTPTPRDRFGMTAIRYAAGDFTGAVVFNRSGVCLGASRRLGGSPRVAWLDDPETLPPGVFDAARVAYLEALT
jgi:hypothetical protein